MIHRFVFNSRDIDPVERIKWCRENFGPRGDRWDFSGGLSITIMIRHQEDADLYNKIWKFWNALKGNGQKESYYHT